MDMVLAFITHFVAVMIGSAGTILMMAYMQGRGPIR